MLAATAITALGKVGVETTSLIALLGAAGLAIGLALQGSLSNSASGVMILLLRPFTIGHKITAAGHTGVVQAVGLFATIMKTPNADTIIIPNSEVTSGSIVNHSQEGQYRAPAPGARTAMMPAAKPPGDRRPRPSPEGTPRRAVG